MAKKFIEPPRPKPEYWKSLKTGNLYLCADYHNWGGGVRKRGKEDLPADEYPYTLVYSKPVVDKWRRP